MPRKMHFELNREMKKVLMGNREIKMHQKIRFFGKKKTN